MRKQILLSIALLLCFLAKDAFADVANPVDCIVGVWILLAFGLAIFIIGALAWYFIRFFVKKENDPEKRKKLNRNMKKVAVIILIALAVILALYHYSPESRFVDGFFRVAGRTIFNNEINAPYVSPYYCNLQPGMTCTGYRLSSNGTFAFNFTNDNQMGIMVTAAACTEKETITGRIPPGEGISIGRTVPPGGSLAISGPTVYDYDGNLEKLPAGYARHCSIYIEYYPSEGDYRNLTSNVGQMQAVVQP